MKTPEKNKLEKLLKDEINQKRDELGIPTGKPTPYYITSKKEVKIREIKKEQTKKPDNKAKQIIKQIDKLKDAKHKLQEELNKMGWTCRDYTNPTELETNDNHKTVIDFKKSLDEKEKELNEIEKTMIIKIWSDGAEMDKVFKEFSIMISKL